MLSFIYIYNGEFQGQRKLTLVGHIAEVEVCFWVLEAWASNYLAENGRLYFDFEVSCRDSKQLYGSFA
jgi:hypothetical protein